MFEVRRAQPTRLEGFVDASFAFAVTLVVISIGHVPNTVPEMLHSLRGVPTFALCFMLIARIWKSHRDWSRRYDIEDGTTIVLSLALVFLVLVYVYPLRLLFSLMFAGFSDGLLVEQPLDVVSAGDVRAAYVVFGLGFAAIWFVFALLYRHAGSLASEIGMNAAEIIATRMQVRLMIVFAGISLLSVVLALTIPMSSDLSGVLPGLAYALMAFARPLTRRPYLRQIDALPTAARS